MSIIAPLPPGFIDHVDEIVREHCPVIRDISYIEHGSDNLVALVNREYVFRFPRHEAAAKRMYFETALLQKLGAAVTVVATPQLVKIHHMPLYAISKFISGEPLSADEVRKLTEDEQVAIGRTLAEFVAQLHASLNIQDVERFRREAKVEGLEEPWPVYFKRLFEANSLPNAKLQPVVDQYYGAWKQYAADEKEKHVIHDDLHPVNLLFSGPRLNGILDFGDTNIGTVEEEMRWFYSMGSIILNAAITRYKELTGKTVDPKHVQMWAIMHELAVFTDKLATDQTNDPSFIRAHTNLKSWIDFPDLR